MINYKSIDKKIMDGYDFLIKGDSVNACDVGTGVWFSPAFGISIAPLS